MTLSTLTDSHILIVPHSPKTWQEAIDLCCSRLLDLATVTPDYPQAIKKIHEDMGPYYVLAPGIALPHARPENGVLSHSLQVTLFQQGMDFGSKDNGDVYLAVTLASTDSQSHIETIMVLSQLFDNEQAIKSIRQAQSSDDILKVLRDF